MSEYNISFTWDDEAQVWLARNDELPIALEAGSLDALSERIKLAVPEILELNSQKRSAKLLFHAEREALVA
jgi:hypothetical protein